MSSRDAFFFAAATAIGLTLTFAATVYGFVVAMRHWHVGRSARMAAAGFGLAAAVQAIFLALASSPLTDYTIDRLGVLTLSAVALFVGWSGVAAAVLLALALKRAWRGETLVSRLGEGDEKS